MFYWRGLMLMIRGKLTLKRGIDLTADLPLTDELTTSLPSKCASCAAELCLRKQVVNLALGNIDAMLCLNCLGLESQRSAEDVLKEIMPYIASRDCFAKQWRKYQEQSQCPDPQGCHVSICFSQVGQK